MVLALGIGDTTKAAPEIVDAPGEATIAAAEHDDEPAAELDDALAEAAEVVVVLGAAAEGVVGLGPAAEGVVVLGAAAEVVAAGCAMKRCISSSDATHDGSSRTISKIRCSALDHRRITVLATDCKKSLAVCLAPLGSDAPRASRTCTTKALRSELSGMMPLAQHPAAKWLQS
jgi:hypothetical protein